MNFGSDSQVSTLMNNASHGDVPWMSQSVTFTASAASEVLSFLALGTPSGVPPFVLLDGVDVQAVPEPSTWVLLGAGAFGLLASRKLRKKRV